MVFGEGAGRGGCGNSERSSCLSPGSGREEEMRGQGFPWLSPWGDMLACLGHEPAARLCARWHPRARPTWGSARRQPPGLQGAPWGPLEGCLPLGGPQAVLCWGQGEMTQPTSLWPCNNPGISQSPSHREGKRGAESWGGPGSLSQLPVSAVAVSSATS